MTRAYIDRKKYERAFRGVFSKLKSQSQASEESLSETERLFLARMNCPVYAAAARMTRLLATDVSKFVGAVQHASSYLRYVSDLDGNYASRLHFTGFPLITFAPGDDPDKVRVYTNLIMDYTYLDQLPNISFATDTGVMGRFHKEYLEDMSSEQRKQAWTPFSRAWKKIKRYEEVSIATALTRYTSLPKHFKADKLRDIAAIVVESRQPLQLIYADKPEDMLVMYERGPNSCMNNSKAGGLGWDVLLFKHSQHPCSFFAYHPYVRGVYAMQNKEVVARTYIYEGESGKWQYGRLYSVNPSIQQKFEEALKVAGYTFMGPHERVKFNRKAEFDIPGILCDGGLRNGKQDYILPFPYMDNMEDNIHVTFDETTKAFHVTCGAEKANAFVKYTKGYWTAEELMRPRCRYCGEDANRHSSKIEAVDGNMFCSSTHASEMSYILAYRSDGQAVYMQGRLAFRDKSGMYFSNREAAVSNGAFPLLGSDSEDEDEDAITVGGKIIRKNGNLYRYTRGDWATLFRPTEEWWGCPTGMFLPSQIYEPLFKEEFMAAAKVVTQRVVEFDTAAPIVIQAA